MNKLTGFPWLWPAEETGGNGDVNQSDGGANQQVTDALADADNTDGAVDTETAEDDEASVVENTDPVFVEPVAKETAGNPIITSIFTADPSAHVWEDGKIYIYASHDMDPARGCDLMDRYHVFSSTDMVNWVDEGEILRADDVAWGRPEGGFMWAPDCAYRDGTYYFYYPHPSGEWQTTWKVGVATSNKPASDFTDQGYIEGLGGNAMIDPCVFIDDDDRVYMYYGGGSMCMGGEMNTDMVSLKTEMKDMEGLEDFHEATWVFKRNGIYYLTYADNNSGANNMRYAISDNPLGPWNYQGIFLKPTGCDTSHGSVAEYKGQWYLFYHNQNISGQGVLRSVCVDKIYFNEDGTIQMVEQTGEGVGLAGDSPAPNPTLKKYEVTDCELGGGATLGAKVDNKADRVINNLHMEGAYCQFNHVDGGNGGRSTIKVYFANGQQLSKLNLNVNGEDYSLLNAVCTWGWQKYTGVASFTLKLNPGETNTIRLTGGNGGINLDYISVEQLDEVGITAE
ncbi:MAG: hypothetical protein K0S76_627 [Herbinix sp.]|nr:hypothetical protein [Herbinix sp.]